MNMNKIFIFLLGASVGSLMTWKIVETKYRRLADEEIESVVEYYKNKEEVLQKKLNTSEELTDSLISDILESKTSEKMSFEEYEYKEKIQDLGYSEGEVEESDDDCIVVTEGAVDFITPFVISPDEFGEAYGYDTKSWTYYADGTLTDEVGEIVSDPESIIGDGLEHFGDYEEDSVFVRNENTECDYEILKHEKTFSEINREDD